MTAKQIETGSALSAERNNEIRREKKKQQRAGRGGNGTSLVANANPLVGTGLGGAASRVKKLTKMADSQRTQLIARIAGETSSRFLAWTRDDSRGIAIWTRSSDIDIALEAIHLAFGEVLGDFDEVLGRLPQGKTHSDDVRRAVILGITNYRNAPKLAQLGITLPIENEKWFSAMRDAMAKRRVSVASK